MPATTIDAAVGLSRYIPPAAIAETARFMEASGVIDGITAWDQLTFFLPPSLWTERITPMAAVMPDIDSFVDPFATLAYAASAAPSLSLLIGTDAVRRSPAELAQSLLTLSGMTTGSVTVQLGAGEIKQLKPFGYKRSQGLKRLEDLIRLLKAQLAATEPIDFEGHHWTFEQAFIGNANKDRRIRIRGLGGGPRLMDIATSYADGIAAYAPGAAPTPARWAETMKQIRRQVAEKGRDPDDFEFGLFPAVCLIHEDANVIDKLLDNPIVRWLALCGGRINQADWELDGITPPIRPDWHYASDLLPMNIGAAEAEAMLAGVTREITERSYFIGTPAQVAEQLRGYVDVGTTNIHIGDLAAMVLPPEDAAQSTRRVIETAAALKNA
jgi:phthiodiolone/phenolphthiodiolone dimycocerosates ketoreductase